MSEQHKGFKQLEVDKAEVQKVTEMIFDVLEKNDVKISLAVASLTVMLEYFKSRGMFAVLKDNTQ